MNDLEDKKVEVDSFVCTNCGANLKFKPGSDHLTCHYCGAENEIPKLDVEIGELDFLSHLKDTADNEEKIIESFVDCNGCGVTVTLEPNVSSAKASRKLI